MENSRLISERLAQLIENFKKNNNNNKKKQPVGSDYHGGGHGFEPQPDQHLGFLISSAIGEDFKLSPVRTMNGEPLLLTLLDVKDLLSFTFLK